VSHGRQHIEGAAGWQRSPGGAAFLRDVRHYRRQQAQPGLMGDRGDHAAAFFPGQPVRDEQPVIQ
jgi:hypothetical protein